MKTFFQGQRLQHRKKLEGADILINPHKSNNFTTSSVSLVRLKNATLFATRRCIRIQAEDGEVLDDLGLSGDDADQAVVDATPVVELDTPLIYFQHFSPQCFYHWLMDSEPNFGVLDLAGIDPKGNYRYYLHALVNDLQGRTLKDYGVDLASVISFFVGSMKNPSPDPIHIRAPEIIVPRFRLHDGVWPHPWSFEFLQSKYLDDRPPHAVWGEPKTNQKKRLYLIRGNTALRNIENESDLKPELESLGFTSVQLERYSLHDQALIMRDAEYVLSSHGSALTNVIFCNPGTRVLEYCGPYLSNHFRSICDILGHDYDAMAAGLSDSLHPLPVSNDGKWRNGSYRIDLGLILSRVRSELDETQKINALG